MRNKLMNELQDYISILRCVNCGGDLKASDTSEHFGQYSCVNGELTCLSCATNYPLVEDIPVMFRDNNRTKLLIDSAEYEVSLKHSADKMKQASQVAGRDQLDRFKEEKNELSDALSWEILFWERWKQADEGFCEFNRNKIDKYLQNDNEGGGRLNFLSTVLSLNDSTTGKRLLNIGAGRDFLLEKFLNDKCQVIEQDIVLESLLLLRKRGACFCVCSDARFLPFQDNTFDMATSFGVLHHIWPIEQPITELLRVTSGHIYFNEPNYFALTRIALLLPGPIKRRLKQFYTGDYSRSPYEDSINPYSFKKIGKNNSADVIKLSFTKSSWISSESKGIKRLLRTMNILLVNMFPLMSSHFVAVLRKAKKNGARPQGHSAESN
jgi:uncharacterized protein YbaR (Trm112 family)